jgi:prephenate dehydratase
VRVGYFGPEGTFTHEALIDAITGTDGLELVALPTIYDTVMAVHGADVERALVPIENSVEGGVNATLDAIAIEFDDVAIVGELVRPIRHALIARRPLALPEIETLVSHPQPLAQCARFIRSELPGVRVIAGSSTAEAVRVVADRDGRWAALGNRVAAARYGCEVLRDGVEDVAGNETRFVWLGLVGAPGGTPGGVPGGVPGGTPGGTPGSEPAADARWKTAVVFWGVGSEAPGWLVSCLSELASRDVNLTRIESRPRRLGLGRYMFFADLEGRVSEPHVAEALSALGGHVEVLRVLGSFPAA